jgi:hypothetical protein
LFSWIVNRISSLLAPSTISTKDIISPMTDEESSIHSGQIYNTNNNNNNNQEEDQSENEVDENLDEEVHN